MPDLTNLLAAPTDQSFFINQLVGSENRFPEKMLIYRRNFLRLADKAVLDYVDARGATLSIIDKQKSHTLGIADGRAVMNVITNKLEDCIITVRRLFDYFDRIKSDATSLPIDRLLKKRIEALDTSIRDIRDLIVHMDKDIGGSLVTFGDSIAPALNQTGDTISVGKSSLPVEFLVRAISIFNGFARELAEYEFRADGTYGPTPKSGPVKR
jgi:hypothetical protein